MAIIIVNPGSMAFRMDTGEMNGSKAVYKTASLGNVRGDADPESLAEIAKCVEAVLSWPVEQVILRRSEILVYQD
jgi:hypothetical protein